MTKYTSFFPFSLHFYNTHMQLLYYIIIYFTTIQYLNTPKTQANNQIFTTDTQLQSHTQQPHVLHTDNHTVDYH